MVAVHTVTDKNTVQRRRESQVKDGRQKLEVEMTQHNISATIQDFNEIPKATSTFSGSSNSVGLVGTLSDIGVSGKLKMGAITGSTYEKMQYLSFYTIYSKKKLQRIHPHFRGLSKD